MINIQPFLISDWFQFSEAPLLRKVIHWEYILEEGWIPGLTPVLFPKPEPSWVTRSECWGHNWRYCPGDWESPEDHPDQIFLMQDSYWMMIMKTFENLFLYFNVYTWWSRLSSAWCRSTKQKINKILVFRILLGLAEVLWSDVMMTSCLMLGYP